MSSWQTPQYEDDRVTLYAGDSLQLLRADENGYDFALGYGERRLFPDASVDAVVTDPPYGLEFMGKDWDSFRLDDPGTRRWRGDRAGAQGTLDATDGIEAVRNLPTYGGQRPRTARCTACGKRDMMRQPHSCGDAAEWVTEITRPHEAPPAMLAFGEWVRQWSLELYRVLKPGGHVVAFGGSRTWHRLAAGIEDAGFEIRDSIAWMYASGFPKSMDVSKAVEAQALHGASGSVVRRAAEQASPGEGFTTRQPVNGILNEPVDTTRKVFTPTTPQARQWAGWGTALKPAFEPIAVARKPLAGTVAATVLAHGTGALNIAGCRVEFADEDDRRESVGKNQHADFGTAPGQNNVYGDYSTTEVKNYDPGDGRWPTNLVLTHSPTCTDDSCVTGCPVAELGEQARFFPAFRFEAKADTAERPLVDGVSHPTVKPLDLMRWLARLVTQPGGTILEPFGGSGTTAEAAVLEGFHAVVIEREAEYLPLIEARIARRRDPVRAIELAGEDAGLFGLLEGESA